MPVNGAETAGSAPVYVRDTSKDSKNSMVDTDTFLKLLVAQLKYQDPLSPQNDTAFVTQLAQMSSLQEMQNMTSTLKNSQAYDMIGKEVYAEVLDKNTGITNCYFGVVDSVIIREGVPYVVVGNTAISVSNVLQVFSPLTEEPKTEEPASEEAKQQDSPTDTI